MARLSAGAVSCRLHSPYRGKKASVLDSSVSPCARRWPKGGDSSSFSRLNSNSTNSSQLAAKCQGVHRGGRWIKRAGFQWVGSDLKRTTCFPCQIRRLLLIPFLQGLKSSVLAPVPYIYMTSRAQLQGCPYVNPGLQFDSKVKMTTEQGEKCGVRGSIVVGSTFSEGT